MNDLHAFVHGTLDLSSSFLLSMIVLSAVATIAGLLLATARAVSAAGRHQLLSLALFFPLIAAIAAAAGLRTFLQRLVPPQQDPPHMVVTATGDLSGIAAASEPSELLCVLVIVWAVGLLAYAIASLAMWRRWNSIARAATEVDDVSLLNELRAAWNDERRMPRLALSSAATEPMVVGFFRPSILLPEHYVGRLTNEELRSVFAHETEHVRRRDNVTALLHELACALFWFDPTKWIARRRLLDLRERACDERVLEIGCEPEPYLAALAKSCHAAIESPVVACMSGFHVRERMDSIMSYQSDRARFFSNRLLRIIAVAAVVLFGITFAVIAPSPALAAGGDAKSYMFEVKVAPRADSRFDVAVVVFDPEGNRVMSSSAVGDGGKPLVLVSEQDAPDPADARQYRIEVNVAPKGPSRATLTVSDGVKRVLHSSTQHSSWSPRPSELPADAQPVARPRPEVPAGYEQVGEGITAPVLMKSVEPEFTEEAKANRVSGICILQALIDEAGVVTDVKVLKPLPFGLSDAATTAVKQWVFEPAKKDGVPVKIAYNVTINFRAEESEPEEAPAPDGQAENTGTEAPSAERTAYRAARTTLLAATITGTKSRVSPGSLSQIS